VLHHPLGHKGEKRQSRGGRSHGHPDEQQQDAVRADGPTAPETLRAFAAAMTLPPMMAAPVRSTRKQAAGRLQALD
jgi:hypothetical protein